MQTITHLPKLSRLNDKTVLVTGANGSIGSEIVRQLLAEDARVIAVVRENHSALDAILESLSENNSSLLIKKMDATHSAEVKRVLTEVFAEVKEVHAFINCIGEYLDGDEWNGDEIAWQKTIETNMLSALYLSKIVGQQFVKQQFGSMVHIASKMATQGEEDAIAYSMTKAGIINLVQAYAKVFVPFGNANAVSPGPVMGGYWLTAPQHEIDRMLARIPMGRFLEPSEVASLALYLCSPAAKMITGQNFQIDLGYSIR